MEPIGVIGGGSWGTALAQLMADQGHPVDLWVHNPELAEIIQNQRENSHYLPGIPLSSNLTASTDLAKVVKDKPVVLSVIPSHVVREVMQVAVPYIAPNSLILSASKGVENDSLLLMDDVLREVLPTSHHDQLCFLAGPSFAREVVEKLPTAVVVASACQATAQRAQHLLSSDYFRAYTTPDVKGALVGGASKNIIAIATGICDGMELGLNTRAALITRGLAEITRLGQKLGAEPLTFSGMAGMGDLVLTCTGNLSRNRTVGLKLGQGKSLSQILFEMKMVAEGVKTTKAVWTLAQKLEVDMPITAQVYEVLYGDKPPTQALKELMGRPLKPEHS